MKIRRFKSKIPCIQQVVVWMVWTVFKYTNRTWHFIRYAICFN